MTDYTDMKQLVEIFEEHHQRSLAQREKSLKEFMKNYPGEPIPFHFLEDFSISNALKHICENIAYLLRRDEERDD